jgi:hypothetical protein
MADMEIDTYLVEKSPSIAPDGTARKTSPTMALHLHSWLPRWWMSATP